MRSEDPNPDYNSCVRAHVSMRAAPQAGEKSRLCRPRLGAARGKQLGIDRKRPRAHGLDREMAFHMAAGAARRAPRAGSRQGPASARGRPRGRRHRRAGRASRCARPRGLRRRQHRLGHGADVGDDDRHAHGLRLDGGAPEGLRLDGGHGTRRSRPGTRRACRRNGRRGARSPSGPRPRSARRVPRHSRRGPAGRRRG